MWQKIHPRWYRTWITKSRQSEWFAKNNKTSRQFFLEDMNIRNEIEEYYGRAWIAKIILRKTVDQCEVILFVAKPAPILGKDGKKLEDLKIRFEKKYGCTFVLSVKQIKVPEFSAKVMAEYVAEQLEKRMPYRRVAKSLMQRVKEKWAIGIKFRIAGRLNGADMSRSETFIDWRITLQKLRADIDYRYTIAMTKYGVLWIKVWIYTNDIYTKWNGKASKKKWTSVEA